MIDFKKIWQCFYKTFCYAIAKKLPLAFFHSLPLNYRFDILLFVKKSDGVDLSLRFADHKQ